MTSVQTDSFEKSYTIAAMPHCLDVVQYRDFDLPMDQRRIGIKFIKAVRSGLIAGL